MGGLRCQNQLQASPGQGLAGTDWGSGPAGRGLRAARLPPPRSCLLLLRLPPPPPAGTPISLRRLRPPGESPLRPLPSPQPCLPASRPLEVPSCPPPHPHIPTRLRCPPLCLGSPRRIDALSPKPSSPHPLGSISPAWWPRRHRCPHSNPCPACQARGPFCSACAAASGSP